MASKAKGWTGEQRKWKGNTEDRGWEIKVNGSKEETGTKSRESPPLIILIRFTVEKKKNCGEKMGCIDVSIFLFAVPPCIYRSELFLGAMRALNETRLFIGTQCAFYSSPQYLLGDALLCGDSNLPEPGTIGAFGRGVEPALGGPRSEVSSPVLRSPIVLGEPAWPQHNLVAIHPFRFFGSRQLVIEKDHPTASFAHRRVPQQPSLTPHRTASHKGAPHMCPCLSPIPNLSLRPQIHTPPRRDI